MEQIIRFDFEAFLQKHFGLVGKLLSDLDATNDELWEDHDLEEFYSKEGWDAWQRAIDLVDDMAEIGLLSDDARNNIIHSFCDNA